MEVDLSSDAQYKQGFLACQNFEFEDDPTKFQDGTKPYNRKRYDFVKSGQNWRYHFRLNDAFLTDIDKYLLPGVEVRLWLTRAMNQFVFLKSPTNCRRQILEVKVVNATCLVHMLELRHETHLSIDRALTRKVAEHEFKEIVAASFLISSGNSVCFRDDIFNRAPKSRLQLSMVPEKNFTGSYATNPFNSEDFDLSTIRVIREGNSVGGTPIDIGKNSFSYI